MWFKRFHSGSKTKQSSCPNDEGMYLIEQTPFWADRKPLPSNGYNYSFFPFPIEVADYFLPLILAVMQDLLRPYQAVTAMLSAERRFPVKKPEEIITKVDKIYHWALLHHHAGLRAFCVEDREVYSVTQGLNEPLSAHFMDNSEIGDCYDVYGFVKDEDLQSIDSIRAALASERYDIHLEYERYPDVLYIDLNPSSPYFKELQQTVRDVIQTRCGQLGKQLKFNIEG